MRMYRCRLILYCENNNNNNNDNDTDPAQTLVVA